jgi:hypothetical protein
MVKIIDNETGLNHAKLLFPLPLLSFSFAIIMASFPIQAFGKYDKDGFGVIRADIGAKSRFLFLIDHSVYAQV